MRTQVGQQSRQSASRTAVARPHWATTRTVDDRLEDLLNRADELGMAEEFVQLCESGLRLLEALRGEKPTNQ